jgi:FKBP-type peptidyl-prolyl cis-trans isomerase FkpA
MKQYLILIGLTSVLLFSFCKSKNEDKTNDDVCKLNEFAAPATEVTALENYLNNNGIIALKHYRGFYYKIETKGTTDSIANNCATVKVKYEGKLTSGQTFDKSVNPVSFQLNQLIQGWQSGIPLIKEGGKIKLYIPPSLGYGNQSAGTIPPNSILIFDIELIQIN